MYCGEPAQVEFGERIGDDAQTCTLRIAGDDAGDCGHVVGKPPYIAAGQ